MPHCNNLKKALRYKSYLLQIRRLRTTSPNPLFLVFVVVAEMPERALAKWSEQNLKTSASVL